MKPFTLAQAMHETKRAKSTIIDAIKSGRMSANRDDRGRYLIDPAELFRCYPQYDGRTDVKTDTAQKSVQLTYQISELKIESLLQQLERERELNRELNRRLDEESLERRKLTALLTHHNQPPTVGQHEAANEKKKNSLFMKIFKKH